MSKANYKRTYWSNGQIQREIYVVNGQQYGLEKWWRPNGQIRCEISYVNGKRHGLEKWWDDNGQIRREISCVNGEQHGLDKYWNQYGEIIDIDLYNNGTYLMELKSNHIHPTRKIRLI